MVGLIVNGVPLLLPKDVSARIDLMAGILDTEIDDSFSLPFQIPIKGNSLALGYIDRVDLASYVLRFDKVTYVREGLPIHGGVLKIFSSTDTHYQASFTVDGFADKSNKLTLPAVNYGPIVRVGTELREHAKTVNLAAYPAEKYCFPMMFCPELHGSENPQWWPNTSPWSYETAYTVGQLVTYAFDATPYRAFGYQCIIDTTPGESPETDPTHWQRTAFGILNHWDHINEEFFANGPPADWGDPEEFMGANFYAMAPMPYWKEVLQKACAAIGLRAEGAFMSDARYDRLAFWSNRVLDALPMEHFFLASQVGSVTYGPTDPITSMLLGQDDTTAPNTDPDSKWNTASSRLVWPELGKWQFRISLPLGAMKPSGLRIRLVEDGGVPVVRDQEFTFPTSILGDSEIIVYLRTTFITGDDSKTFYFTVTPYDALDTSPITLEGCWISGWKQSGTGLVNAFATEIDLRNHVPDITVGAFIAATRDRFCLHLKPDTANGVLRFDYIDDTLRSTPVDMSAQRTGPIQLRHETAEPGTLFSEDANDMQLADVTGLLSAGEVDTEDDLGEAQAPGFFVVVTNSRKVFASTVHHIGGAAWKFIGYRNPTVEVGSTERRVEVKPAFTPPGMDIVASQDEEFLVPRMYDKSTSVWFTTGSHKPSLKMFFFYGMVENANAIEYPFASPFAYDHAGVAISDVELDIASPMGPYELHHKRLAAARATGIPATTDFKITTAQMVQKVYQRPFLIDHLKYLPVRLPVHHDNGPLLATDCELLLLK